ncbi:MAG: hypothetical protein ABI622_01340 [Chloroflexota bacterium]
MRRTGQQVASRVQALSIIVLAAGASILLVMAAAASLNEYGRIALADGYWLGPLPWTPIGIGLSLYGATATVLASTAIAWLTDGWAARLVAIPAVLSVAAWWATAPLLGMAGACCGTAVPFDPVTIAYSAPLWTALLVGLPAIVLSAVDWLWRPAQKTGAGPDYRTVSGA